MRDIVVIIGRGVSGLPRGGPLMDAHGVRERAGEEVVVALRDSGEDLRERCFLRCGKVCDGGNVPGVREHCGSRKREDILRRSNINTYEVFQRARWPTTAPTQPNAHS